ncbi:MAG: hypothetical protein Q4D85_08505 [Corynebacterium sp.]|uniref:hypothetical protein n=1 Tax=Corynebacterium sp. TaxID=1720 RepID=UPI0026DAB4D2|nr:hypothetical protein [Corynebacterium sp.]MDO5098787.1 hypothetical protein [Corynebacterium sp.]
MSQFTKETIYTLIGVAIGIASGLGVAATGITGSDSYLTTAAVVSFFTGLAGYAVARRQA